MVYKRVPKEIKEEILKKVKEGLPVAQVAKQYGVNPQSIYNWLGGDTNGRKINPILEINRLKRENKELYEILGKATAMMEKQKKESS
jgi:transposase-like protein